MAFVDRNVSEKLKKSPRQLLAQCHSSKEGFTTESLFVSIEKKWNGDYQLLHRKRFREEAVRVAKRLATYLYKEHGKDVLPMFAAHHQKEAKNCFWDSNNKTSCSDEKEAQDVIDEKPFAWLELPDDFSLNSNKRTKTDDSEVEVDDISVFTSKTIDFLSPSQRKECQSSKSTSNFEKLDSSETAQEANSTSESKSIEGVEGHGMPSALDS